MNEKWTKGWRTEIMAGRPCWWSIYGDDGRPVLTIDSGCKPGFHENDKGRPVEERKANAALALAAPAMAKALAELVSLVAAGTDYDASYLSRARAALAAARGENVTTKGSDRVDGADPQERADILREAFEALEELVAEAEERTRAEYEAEGLLPSPASIDQDETPGLALARKALKRWKRDAVSERDPQCDTALDRDPRNADILAHRPEEMS